MRDDVFEKLKIEHFFTNTWVTIMYLLSTFLQTWFCQKKKKKKKKKMQQSFFPVQFPQTKDLFTIYIGLRLYNTFTNTLQMISYIYWRKTYLSSYKQEIKIYSYCSKLNFQNTATSTCFDLKPPFRGWSRRWLPNYFQSPKVPVYR